LREDLPNTRIPKKITSPKKRNWSNEKEKKLKRDKKRPKGVEGRGEKFSKKSNRQGIVRPPTRSN